MSKIVKYLFSDISEQGIPEHFGCFPFIIGWLRRTLNAIAGLGIVLFVVLIICGGSVFNITVDNLLNKKFFNIYIKCKKHDE